MNHGPYRTPAPRPTPPKLHWRTRWFKAERKLRRNRRTMLRVVGLVVFAEIGLVLSDVYRGGSWDWLFFIFAWQFVFDLCWDTYIAYRKTERDWASRQRMIRRGCRGYATGQFCFAVRQGIPCHGCMMKVT